MLDDRVLLAAAFAGFTQELDRLGLDRPNATMPALTGDLGIDGGHEDDTGAADRGAQVSG